MRVITIRIFVVFFLYLYILPYYKILNTIKEYNVFIFASWGGVVLSVYNNKQFKSSKILCLYLPKLY